MLKKKCFKNIIQIKSLKYSILTNTRIKFEYFPYLDIFEYSQNYKLTNEEKKNILYDIAYAIYNLHFNNICHGDLKLENILYNPNSDFPKIKLIDFESSTFCPCKSKNYRVKYTPEYCAPERNKRNFGLYNDIWSYGILAYIIFENKILLKEHLDLILFNKDNISLYTKNTELINLLKEILVPYKERISIIKILSHKYFSK